MRNTIATLFASFLFFSCANTPADQNDDKSTSEDTKKDNPVSSPTLFDGNYNINSELSTCRWLGTGIADNRHNGSLNVYKGSVVVNNNNVTSGIVSMDMTSIEVEDLSGASKKSLTNHLKSEDFFGVEQYRTSQLKLGALKTREGKSYAIGDLKIRGIVKPIAFPLVVTQEGKQLVFDGDMAFDRSQYDVKFRSGSFPDLFPDLGDKLINDTIVISFHLLAEPS